ncbi:hypothetical protein ACFRAI_41495 [Streptomyces sp. NPDC056637]|uniref:hypothetical protein n=1 Tax=Streptomyces sp. NPDC056637 TaxID=3345886 RepID=UPI0036A67B43
MLDIVHVLEKLWAAARCLHPPSDPAAEDWIALKAARILAGDAAGCARDLRTEADTRQLASGDRTGVDKAADYLQN